MDTLATLLTQRLVKGSDLDGDNSNDNNEQLAGHLFDEMEHARQDTKKIN